MLGWTYLAQLTRKYIRIGLGAGIDKFRWAADRADLLMNPADRRPVHIDAMIVHEAVAALGADLAAIVIDAALWGDFPQWMDEEDCRPYPEEPQDRYDDYGTYTRPDGRQGRYRKRIAGYVSLPKSEEYVRAGRKKMRAAANDNGLERVPVEYSGIRWEPEPEFVQANNELVAQWQAARPVLIAALRDEPAGPRFRDHVLAEDAPTPLVVAVAANDNEPLAANDNEAIAVVRVA
jgi:hypothetical protein